LAKARAKLNVRLALTFDYGQRAAAREVERAGLLAAHFGVAHEVVRLPWFAKFTHTALLGRGEVPVGREVGIDDRARSEKTAERVWVPNRNGVFLNIAAGFAEGLGAGLVIPGFNREEAQTFPDNSEEYLRALDEAFKFSTGERVKTHCFSTGMDKTQIVADADNAGVPLFLLWPCYFSGEEWCGECESCQRFKRALEANGMSFEKLRKEGA
jgi:7-cyano-7-deazaguanine synthase